MSILKRTKKSESDLILRRILVKVILDNEVCGSLQKILSTRQFRLNEFFPEGSAWILEKSFAHYQKYGQAPQEHIQDIFQKEFRGREDDLRYDLIKEVLISLQQEADTQAEFILSEAIDFIHKRELQLLYDKGEQYIKAGRVKEASELTLKYSPPSIEMLTDQSPSLLTDFAEWESIINSDIQKPLFQVRGQELNKLISPLFTRKSFGCVLGPEKRGKSWFLQFLAMEAWRERNNVMYFECGDMSEAEVKMRLGAYIGKLSLTYWKREEVCPRNDITIKTTKITPEKAFRVLSNFSKGRKKFGFKSYPNTTLTVRGMRVDIANFKAEHGVSPDVVIVDYADILAPEIGDVKDRRHQEDERWKALRRLSQELDCCVITASQANSNAYRKDSLNMGNFSEDKRKNAHITFEIGLNQTEEEKAMNKMRVNVVLARHTEFNSKRHVVVQQCFLTGRPHVTERDCETCRYMREK